jgi:hypothetical protein
MYWKIQSNTAYIVYVITYTIYVVLDGIFQYIIYSNQHNGMESIKLPSSLYTLCILDFNFTVT